jgi:L-alanine-DL-glutamate epimerase-like enolase superfamily enzyme
MRIDKVDVFLVSTAVDSSLADSTRKIESVGYVIVRLSTDDGLTGLGITYDEVGGEAIRQLIVKELAPLIIGKNPFETEVIWEKISQYVRGVGRKGLTFCALSAVDIALWDLKGKMAGMPVYKLLGGNKSKIPVYACGGWTSYNQNELVKEMQSMVANGYTMVKMKIGVNDGRCPEEDIKRVRLVRQELGPQIEIAIDANNAFKSATAIRIAHKLDECNLYFFEEPVMADDMEGLAKVRESIDIPVATGEHEYTKYGVRDLLLHKAADIIQPDVTRCGGITEWMKMATIAHAWNIMMAPHGMEYMSMHLLGAISNGLMLERVLLFEPLNEIVFVNPPQPRNGYIEIPDEPGLGLELNMDNIRKYGK